MQRKSTAKNTVSKTNSAPAVKKPSLRNIEISYVPKNDHQKELIKAIQKYDFVFGIGEPGTGKTFLMIAAALQALFNKEIEKIWISRPAVENSKTLGYLPGDLFAKVINYCAPILDAMHKLIGPELTSYLLESKTVEILPIGFLRGRNIDSSWLIIDEAQNMDVSECKAAISRVLNGSKVLFSADPKQCDLPIKANSCIPDAIQRFKNVSVIKFVYFDKNDIQRHSGLKEILEAYETDN
jgi:phosphate starvation-inducible PhoH-like protein